MGAGSARRDERDAVSGHDDMVEAADDMVDEDALDPLDWQATLARDLTGGHALSGQRHLGLMG